MMGFFFFSCSQDVQRESFVATLDRIDGYITGGGNDAAHEALKELSAIASSGDQWLSIVKRYVRMGYLPEAEETLAAALGKFPGSDDMLSVYIYVLLRQGRTEDAAVLAESLKDTARGGLWAEALLSSGAPPSEVISGADISPVFLAAWRASGNPQFLQNAAAVRMLNGNGTLARSLHPPELSPEDNPLFWAYLSYDTGSYLQAYEDSDGNGTAGALYFPNRYLPMKADLFNRVLSVYSRHTSNLFLFCYLPLKIKRIFFLSLTRHSEYFSKVHSQNGLHNEDGPYSL